MTLGSGFVSIIVKITNPETTWGETDLQGKNKLRSRLRSLRFLLSIHEDARQDDKNINFKILIDLGGNKEDGVMSTYVVVKNTNRTCRNHK